MDLAILAYALNRLNLLHLSPPRQRISLSDGSTFAATIRLTPLKSGSTAAFVQNPFAST
jgi:hypothetical protein